MASTHTSQDDEIHGINVTPLVDIMLVLLIVFMVTAVLDAPAAVGVDLPRASTAIEAPIPTLAVVIEASGAVRENGELVTLETLARRAEHAAGESSETRAVIAGDAGVSYRRVMEVMDTLRGAGVHKLALAVETAR